MKYLRIDKFPIHSEEEQAGPVVTDDKGKSCLPQKKALNRGR